MPTTYIKNMKFSIRSRTLPVRQRLKRQNDSRHPICDFDHDDQLMPGGTNIF